VTFRHARLGGGILDFEYYLRCAKQSGFNGPLVMHGLDEIDVPFSREFLRQTLAKFGFIS
jgi:sugar phosphate isomerase/epimerase